MRRSVARYFCSSLLVIAALAVLALLALDRATATAPAVGTIRFLDSARNSTADYYFAPRGDGSAWVVSVRDGQYAVRSFNLSGVEGTEEALAIDVSQYWSGGLFCRGAEDGRIWLSSFDWFGYFDPTSHLLHRIALPHGLARTPEASSSLEPLELESWRVQRVTDMALGADGSIWLARDYKHSLEEYDSRTNEFREYGPTSTVDVPGYLHPVGDGLAFTEYRSTHGGPGHTNRIDPILWSPVTHSTAAVDGGGMLQAVAPDGTLWFDGESGSRFVPAGKVAAQVGNVPVKHTPGDWVAAGPRGDLWLLQGHNLVMYNTSTNEQTVYKLPTPSIPYVRGLGARNTQRIPQSSPRFVDAKTDESGNLWFSYSEGFTYAGVAIR